jgi:archaellum component FlaC
MPPKFIGRFADSDMRESITQPRRDRESLESVTVREDNSRMSEETTQNLPQDNLGLILVRLDSIDSRLGNIEGRLSNVEDRLTNVENRLSNVENRLSTLEDKVERRLQDTRPIWEQVLVRLDGFESELRTGLRRFERNVGRLAEDVLEVRAYQRDLEKRMDDLEPKTT